MPVRHGRKLLQMTRFTAFAFVAVAALVSGVSCTEKGRSLVLVNLTTDVTSIEHVRVVVVQGNAEVGSATADWPPTGSPPGLKVGIYVPKDISGAVDVYACGFAGDVSVAGNKMAKPTSVMPGMATAELPIALVSGEASSICSGTGGTGGMGGGGRGGTTGVAGAGGAAAGAGGSGAAGASGAAGTSGGAGGGGGGAIGGASGGGRGGMAGGSAGMGGGMAGTTGVAGSAVAGGGGRGGMAGGAAGAGAGGTGGGQVVGMWRGPVAVAADPALTEMLPQVAVDGSGNAVVVYEHGAEIWSNYYSATTATWGTPGAIDARPGSDAQQANIAVDKNGGWLAVWAQSPNGTLKGIYTSSSTNGTTWSAITPLTNTPAWEPVLAMNADGAAIVAWSEAVGNPRQAAATTRATTGSAWGAATVMRPADDTGDRTPVVAMSGTGEGFVLWTQSDTAGWISVWMRQHTPTAWQPAALFESYEAQSAYAPGLAANKAGTVVGSYLQVTSATMQLWTRRYTPGSGFAAALKAGEATDIDSIVNPTITLDESGVATVAFAGSIQQKFQAFTNRAGNTDAAWPTAMAMETDNAAAQDDPTSSIARSSMPIVKNDTAGNVTLIWRKRTGTRFDMYARRYPVGGPWGAQTLLETRDTYSVFWPSLGVGTGGPAVAVWYYGSELDIWANVWR